MSTDKLPQNYAELKTALKELFNDWRKALEAKFGEDFKDNKFVEDGAFPGYFNHQLKILFVGREAYGCEGLRDVWKREEGCPCKYKNEDQSYPCDGRKLMISFAASKYARKGQKRPRVAQRAAKVTYGIQNRIPGWQKIPYPAGVSFAFMDVSKFAHMRVEKSENSPKFSEYAFGSLELTRKEIDILNPNLIISWNLAREPGVDFLKRLTDPSLKGPFPDDPKSTESNPVSIWTYKGKREIPLLNTYHFSAPVSPEKYIYEPVMRAVKELIEQRKDKDKAWSELSKIWSQS